LPARAGPISGRFAGKSALITGGTSGLGAEAARQLLAEGASVVVTGRDRERGAAIERELSPSGSIAFLEADARSPAAADEAVGETKRRFGGIDILVASAGVGVVSSLAETTAEDWESIWSTNVSGTLFAAQAAIKAMRESRRAGSIVLIGSDAGMLGERSIGAYSVTKAAVIMMTRVLALDGAGDGIRVNCVCPGYFEPGMRHFPDRSSPGADPDQGGYTDPPAPPIGRYANVAEIAREVLHFADSTTSFCTGSVLLVDGGATAGIP
jgi:NAD(P)-dependent dehydrogenase (short-subunit alcohol dehydrogenase family)